MPFAALYSRALSKSHNPRPASAAYARKWPSTDPENTTPGMAVSAADCAGLQPGVELHGGGAAYHAFRPSFRSSAVKPPPSVGFNVNRAGSFGSPSLFGMRTTSETAAYTWRSSLAIPHCTPPFTPPLPTRACQTISPFFAGSSAYTMPDFCPAISRSRPGPFSGGQFAALSPHAELDASSFVICLDHAIWPVLMSRAITASLVSVAGVE